jgi:hypothetical protein
MKNFNSVNRLNQKNKTYHVVISEVNYRKLKSLGKMGDTFDKVLGELLSKC